MSSIELSSVRKAFGALEVIRDIDLSVAEGEFCIFVGPSGCGKSTLLRLIAGLETMSGGDIRIGDTVVNDLAPAERGLAMVFQSYALYPHMTVRQNMSFGLRRTGHSKAETEARVKEAATILQLQPLMDRKPSQLSGGQRQRVAIGRAIVRKPRAFLFDEPLSNLDAELRAQMRVELAELHRQLGATMIYVTHDQVEAMTLADKIVVLRDGRIEQIGTPDTLYNDPDNIFVAGFIGSPRMNLLKLEGSPLANGKLSPPAGAVTVGLRPESLEIGNDIAAKVGVVENLGGTSIIHADLGDGQTIIAEARGATRPQTGTEIGFALPSQPFYFDGEGKRIRNGAVTS
ncbi:UNVERIFIED_ORG: carbohydrate ABC transporter ATP-binding protein (CUT1 family) [Martelella mediterranea]